MLLRERRVREDHAADREPERGPAAPSVQLANALANAAKMLTNCVRQLPDLEKKKNGATTGKSRGGYYSSSKTAQ